MSRKTDAKHTTAAGPTTATPNDAASRSRARKWALLGGGYGLLAIGGALLILPGPGIPLVLGGLALLSKEARWAVRARERLARAVTQRERRTERRN